MKISWLNQIERLGNRLPDPVYLFIIGTVVIVFLAELAVVFSWQVEKPSMAGAVELIHAQTILSKDGIWWWLSTLVKNFIEFPPLGIVLVGMGMVGYWTMDTRFWNKMEAARLEQSICIYAAMWAGLHTYGLAHANTSIHEAAQEADYIILWGANLVSTGVHAIPFIREAKERGAKLVVIDPRQTRTTMSLFHYGIKN